MNIKALIGVLAFASAMLSSTHATAHEVVYTATLTGSAEAPPNASLGTGTALVTINDHDFTMRVQTSFSGLTGNVTAAHIHCCTAVPGTGTAGVASVTPSFTAFPSGGTSGTYDRTFDMTLTSGSWNNSFITANGGTPGTAFSALLAGLDSGKAYLNIHTTAFGGGEIRGFLTLAPVPEPETYGMLLAGLALVGAVARRRKVAV